MDQNKKSPKTDKHKTTTNASSKSGKNDEKDDENVLSKAAHKIGDKVHNFTDDVKEKAHHLTHSDDPKKDKGDKKEGTKLKTSSKIDKKDSDDEKEKDTSKPPPPPPSSSSEPPSDDKEGGSGSGGTAAAPPSSKPPGLPSQAGKQENSAAAPPSSKKTGPDPASKAKEPPSGGDSKPPGEKKDDDAAAAPSSKAPGSSSASKFPGTPADNQKAATTPPSSKPASNEKDNTKSVDLAINNDSKQSASKPNSASGDADTSNKLSTEENPNDKVHILFDGVETVDDLLERIDEAIEKANVVVTSSKDKNVSDKKERQNVSGRTANNTGKKTEVKAAEEEPVRIPYGDVHQLKDILALVNDQPGHRKVVLEGAPKQSSSATIKKSNNSPSATTSPVTTNEQKDLSTKEKPTENQPSSNDTSSSKADQIHINIDNIQCVDNLLDRVDDAIQNVPVVIDVESHIDKAPSSPSESKEHVQNEVETQKQGEISKKEIATAMKFQKQNPEIEQENNEISLIEPDAVHQFAVQSDDLKQTTIYADALLPSIIIED
ncbi:unnamed protein product [Rotaria sp. Silwood2]|nr:unnamed protein product [Rotaria sp. Silwood2]CAF2886960.1 unnamed protein product [Rotaria sp. Silwood2]CAF3107339.1 unnamed protein product [Rotaria sp. Silwood2]CAF3137528.1 unnamed protein product [Rotaria sp. Silwood2]CAF3926615.1 unnamed protein product [Rotaria sp. Silwood2]